MSESSKWLVRELRERKIGINASLLDFTKLGTTPSPEDNKKLMKTYVAETLILWAQYRPSLDIVIFDMSLTSFDGWTAATFKKLNKDI